MKKQGVLTVISGFSGAGKGTIVKELIKKHDTYSLSISATTRKPREGEVHGREYFFKTVEEFEEMIQAGEFIEWAKFVDNYYGTPRAYVEEQMAAGRDVILEIEIQGAMNVKKMFPDALLLFVTPPSAEELKNRLVGRGTETDEVIANRLRRAVEESPFMNDYDYIMVNDDLESCVEKVHQTISSYHFTKSQSGEIIEKMQQDLKQFL